ncbi:MAG TPA: lasso RiPP family leader peptide-containing protein [Thermoanaerobaculaceae bacterium]|nr:lasso RiPP family leader peptide-containing protein [Thermoanaerobaculaceae bacterium]
MTDPDAKSPPYSESTLRKKRYEKPILETLGTLSEITRSTGTLGMGDGAKQGNTKTH